MSSAMECRLTFHDCHGCTCTKLFQEDFYPLQEWCDKFYKH